MKERVGGFKTPYTLKMTDILFETTRIDPRTIRKTYANENGDVRDVTITDLDPLIEANKEFAKVEQSRKANGKLVARIDMSIIEHWRHTLGIDWFTADEATKRALLNDPDNAFLRTGGGRL